MGCAQACSSCMVIVINLIFLIIGLGIAAVGGVLKWGSGLISQYLKTSIENGSASNKASDVDIQAFVNDVFQYLGMFGLIIFLVGLVLFLLSLFAICGVCCKSKWVLGTYAFIVGLITLGIIAFTVVLFVKTNWVRDIGNKELTQFVANEYKGPADSKNLFKGISGVLDLIQVNFQCCGVTNSSDYDKVQWNKNFTYEKDGHNKTFYLQIPVSCCKFEGNQVNTTCLENPDTENSNMQTGCYQKLWDKVEPQWSNVRYGHIGLCVFLVVLFVLTVCAMRYEKEKIDPI